MGVHGLPRSGRDTPPPTGHRRPDNRTAEEVCRETSSTVGRCHNGFNSKGDGLMAINRDPNLSGQDVQTTGNTRVYDTDTAVVHRSGSNWLPYLIGGLVIALGLLAFLFYDGGNTSRDVSTTGSTTTTQSAPATGAVTTPTPPATTAPATPTTPAPRQ
jgi:hypothetical protein